MRSSVVLPQPEGPSSTKNSPALMSRLTSSTAVTRPKRFETLRIWMIGWRGLSVINDPKSVRVEPSRDTVMACTNDRHLDFARCERGERLHQCVSAIRSEEHTSELQSLMRISYAVFCLKKKKKKTLKASNITIMTP